GCRTRSPPGRRLPRRPSPRTAFQETVRPAAPECASLRFAPPTNKCTAPTTAGAEGSPFALSIADGGGVLNTARRGPLAVRPAAPSNGCRVLHTSTSSRKYFPQTETVRGRVLCLRAS